MSTEITQSTVLDVELVTPEAVSRSDSSSQGKSEAIESKASKEARELARDSLASGDWSATKQALASWVLSSEDLRHVSLAARAARDVAELLRLGPPERQAPTADDSDPVLAALHAVMRAPPPVARAQGAGIPRDPPVIADPPAPPGAPIIPPSSSSPREPAIEVVSDVLPKMPWASRSESVERVPARPARVSALAGGVVGSEPERRGHRNAEKGMSVEVKAKRAAFWGYLDEGKSAREAMQLVGTKSGMMRRWLEQRKRRLAGVEPYEP